MKEIEDSNLAEGSEENISDNVFPHLNSSVSQPDIQAENKSLSLNGSDKTPPEDILKPLTVTEKAKKHKYRSQEEKTRTPLYPLPKNAPVFTKDTPTHHNKQFNSKPIAIYPYTMADVSIAFYMVRWHPLNQDGMPTLDEEDKPLKVVFPYCYVEDEKGKQYWWSCGYPAPRPLYNFPEILARSQAPVLVVEGEKVVDTLKSLLPDYVLTTSAHGAKSTHKSDWSALKNRNVIICPDLDNAGVYYGDAVCMKSREAGALSIQSLDLELLVKSLLKKEIIPKGYDLADAVNDGLNIVLLNRYIESFLSPYLTSNEKLNQKFPDKTFRINNKGDVEYWYEKKNNRGDIVEKEWRWLCGYLVVTHSTRDKDNGGWAKVATIVDNDGIRKEVKITASFLSGDGNALVELLLKSGLPLNIENKKKLIQYLNRSNPSSRRRTVDKVGWYKDAYVLSHKTYGNSEREDIVLEMGGELPTYRVQGTLAEWSENIGKHIENNSRLQGAVLLALTSPLLTPLGHENFGIHSYGHSAIGKSTASHIACSVYGSELRTWRTTDNSAEAWGMQSNDNILVLDEISQVSGEALSESIYMLFNGQGKGRMLKKGGTRPTSKFKICVWSNGETGAESKIKESKRNKTYNAGQAVRMMEIPADAGQGFGIFDTLHEFKDGATFSNRLKEKSQAYCGSVGDAWLKLLTEDREEILEIIKQNKQSFIKNTPLEQKIDGQVDRARNHFALMAAVGEVAIEKRILPWKTGSANKACKTLLKAWTGQRGGIESHEVMDFKKRVINFLLKNGSTRFEMIGQTTIGQTTIGQTTIGQTTDDAIKLKTKDRMGFSKEIGGRTIYYAFTETFDKELIQGGDKKMLMNVLVEKGFLERDKDQFAKLIRLPDVGMKRVYVLSSPDDS